MTKTGGKFVAGKDEFAGSSVAVLCSGGLDSAVLVGHLLRQGSRVFPLFVRCGLYWEKTELLYLRRFLKGMARDPLKPLTLLDVPVTDLYGTHWSITGSGVPDASTPDEAVFLPGRNVLLLGKSLLWCRLHGVAGLAMGLLKSNPFPDATPAFFRAFAGAVNQAVDGELGGNVKVLRPFAGMKKKEVVRLGRDMPLEHSLSCMRPIKNVHCGRCNKCAERQLAFREAEMMDPTRYAAD
jgi:7-cyano-7-deazaguanine synthase